MALLIADGYYVEKLYQSLHVPLNMRALEQAIQSAMVAEEKLTQPIPFKWKYFMNSMPDEKARDLAVRTRFINSLRDDGYEHPSEYKYKRRQVRGRTAAGEMVEVETEMQSGVDVGIAYTLSDHLAGPDQKQTTDLVLLAGDGDLKAVVVKARRAGLRVWLVGEPGTVNLELKSLVHSRFLALSALLKAPRPRSPSPSPHPGPVPSPVANCRKGEACKLAACRFAHPPGRTPLCKFGVNCTRSDCKFLHPKKSNSSESDEETKASKVKASPKKNKTGPLGQKKPKQSLSGKPKTKATKAKKEEKGGLSSESESGMSSPTCSDSEGEGEGEGKQDAKSIKQCKHGARCRMYDCAFSHPEGRAAPCRFRENCTKADCSYLHPKTSAANANVRRVATGLGSKTPKPVPCTDSQDLNELLRSLNGPGFGFK